MKTELYLHIPKPCHENWDVMTPVDKGRFCTSCNKEVVDFSLLSDVEVLNFFKKSTGNTCGRFTDDQLQRPLQETKIEKKKGWKWMLASITSLLMISKSNAQKKEKCYPVFGKIKTEQPNNQINSKRFPIPQLLAYPTIKPLPPAEPSMITLGAATLVIPGGKIKAKGVVVDEKNNPLPGAVVRIVNSQVPVFTDQEGYFEIPTNQYDTISVELKAFGFITKNAVIDLTKDQPAYIAMAPKVDVLPEVVVVSYVTQKRLDRTGSVIACSPVTRKDTVTAFIRKVVDTASPFTILSNPLKIYPNPVAKNSIIHLSIKDAGNYLVLLFDNASRLLHAEENTTTVKQQTVDLQLPANMSSGIHYIRITNMKTKRSYVEKLILQ